MSKHNTNRVTASDYGIHGEMPMIPDTMVVVAEYARRLVIEDAQQLVATGERIPAVSRLIRIATELGHPDADTQDGIDWIRTIISQGEAIIWDRELRAMSDEERADYLRPYLDPNFDPREGLTAEQLELVDDFASFMEQAKAEADQRNKEIEMFRQMFGE